MFRAPNKTQLYKEITLNKENSWTYVFDTAIDLNQYYYEEDTSNFPEGVEIDETDYADGYSKTSDFVKFYNKWESPDNPVRVVLSVHKTWKDNNNAEGKRPREITVKLYQNGNFLTERKLNSSNNWSDTMEKKDALPKYNPDTGEEYEYKWEEEADSLGDDYELVSEKTETTEDTQYTYKTTELINAYSDFTTASVEKSWEDEDDLYAQRPEELKAHLLADGKRVDRFTLETTDSDGKTTTTNVTDGTVTLTKSNGWKATAVNLQKYNGNNRIQYTWEEELPDGYKQLENSMTLENEDSSDECFKTKLRNQYEPQYGKVTVSKVIPVSSLDFRRGDITFEFHLVGSTIHKAAIGYKRSVTFSQAVLKNEKNIVTIDGKKYLKLSVTFENLDWGSYTVTESGSESRYQFDKIDGLKNATVGTDRNGNATISFNVNKENLEFTGTYHNRTIPAGLKIIKFGKLGIGKLEGVTFKVEKVTEDGKKAVATGTTDKNGEVLFSDLEPGDYMVTETKTVKGHTLLTEPFKVTLPLTLTKEEAEEKKADTSKAIYDDGKKLCFFYTLTYNVKNSAEFEVPHTGMKDSLKTYLPIVAAMILVVGTEVFVSVGGKKSKKRQALQIERL